VEFWSNLAGGSFLPAAAAGEQYYMWVHGNMQGKI